MITGRTGAIKHDILRTFHASLFGSLSEWVCVCVCVCQRKRRRSLVRGAAVALGSLTNNALFAAAQFVSCMPLECSGRFPTSLSSTLVPCIYPSSSAVSAQLQLNCLGSFIAAKPSRVVQNNHCAGKLPTGGAYTPCVGLLLTAR